MRKTIFLLAALCAFAGPAHADQAHDEVVTFVKSAITAIHKNEQAAFARFNDKKDHQFHPDGLLACFILKPRIAWPHPWLLNKGPRFILLQNIA